MRVLVLGATSLVGSHFVAHPPAGVEVEAAGRTDPGSRGLPVRSFTPLDLGDEEGVRSLLRGSSAEAWINFAARTDVDGCERERPTTAPAPGTPAAPGSAWRLNAELPGWLAQEATAQDRFLVHLSTDFVFDGREGPYPEAARAAPFGPRVSWYGYTKGVGEGNVEAARGRHAVLRLAFPYRGPFDGKEDLARTILSRGRTGTLFPLYGDQQITPTWIPDVTLTLSALLASPRAWTVHVASPTLTTPLEFGRTILAEAGLPPGTAPAGELGSGAPAAGRAPRPVRGGLQVARAMELGVHPTDFREGARLLARELARPSPSKV